MRTRGILDNRLAADIMGAEDTGATLQKFLDTIVYMRESKAEVFADKNTLYEQVVSGTQFADWIFDMRPQSEYREQKRELMLLIEMSKPAGRTEYEAILSEIEGQACQKELSVSIHTDSGNVLYVDTVARLLDAKRWFLASRVSRSDFSTEAPECFPRLFFHGRVGSSMNTLCANFTRERPLIVEHLAALDGFAPEFRRMSGAGNGNTDMAHAFEDFYGHRIECSPENDRDTARKLDFPFTSKNREEKILRCELHTKLKWDDMDKEHQDRIYFHPGDSLVADGRVLIAHIGEHL